MSGVARSRLAEERKAWRKDKPFGFHARPETAADGSVNLMSWKCHIPGKKETDWAGGFYPLTMEFSEDYPTKPPKGSSTPTSIHRALSASAFSMRMRLGDHPSPLNRSCLACRSS
mmetsp:Transcript_20475/g.56771  ORF Transcript_20475/g.56771 Transcript_20475/m.56771 type:complete len:115 (+) Transcript_20475:173-517(+)